MGKPDADAERVRMTGISTIDDIGRVEHTCLIPDSEDHLWEATAAYVAGGLAAGERVVYFENETADVLLDRLADDRVPVACALADGGLIIVPTARTRQVCAYPVADIVELMRQQIVDADIEGWPGIRLAGESRELLPIGGLRKLVEYETAVDVLLTAHPNAGMLCRFDRRFFDDEAVAAMREVHPTELVTSALYDDTLLRVTGSAATALRFAGEIDLSNRPQVRRLLDVKKLGRSRVDEEHREQNAPESEQRWHGSASLIGKAKWQAERTDYGRFASAFQTNKIETIRAGPPRGLYF